MRPGSAERVRKEPGARCASAGAAGGGLHDGDSAAQHQGGGTPGHWWGTRQGAYW